MAIVGGLLVARFVGLDSDQQTSRKLLIDASDRLAIALTRADAARQDLLRWRARDFLNKEGVVEAIASGRTDITELRKFGYTPLTNDELNKVVNQATEDIATLRTWLSSAEIRQRIRDAEYQWPKFPRDSIPALNFPQLTNPIFTVTAYELEREDEEKRRREEARQREKERRRREEESQRRANDPTFKVLGMAGSFGIADSLAEITKHSSNMFKPSGLSNLSKSVRITPPNAMLIDANRRDDLIATVVRTGQRVEDLGEELRRLRQQHTDIVKPDARMWWAIVILTAYAIAGVAVPLWVMSTGPASLSTVRWTFWPFIGGLAALIGYIAWYLIGLTRRRRQWALTDSANPSKDTS